MQFSFTNHAAPSLFYPHCWGWDTKLPFLDYPIIRFDFWHMSGKWVKSWSLQGISENLYFPATDATFSASSLFFMNVVVMAGAAAIVARHLPAHLPDTRHWSRATPACSSAWYSASEPSDTCLLFCLILTSGAAWHMPAHLPDTRDRKSTRLNSSHIL